MISCFQPSRTIQTCCSGGAKRSICSTVLKCLRLARQHDTQVACADLRRQSLVKRGDPEGKESCPSVARWTLYCKRFAFRTGPAADWGPSSSEGGAQISVKFATSVEAESTDKVHPGVGDHACPAVLRSYHHQHSHKHCARLSFGSLCNDRVVLLAAGVQAGAEPYYCTYACRPCSRQSSRPGSTWPPWGEISEHQKSRYVRAGCIWSRAPRC